MATPDDEYKTVGLPPGARDRLVREIERQKPTAAGPGSPTEARPPAPPTPPQPPKGRKPAPSAPGDREPESFATIPPAGGFPRRRETPGWEDPTPPVDPWSQSPPLQPWGAEAGASPPAVQQPEPPHQSVHSGWTMAGSPAVAPPSPWQAEKPLGSLPHPPQPLIPQETPPTGLTPIPPGGGEAERAGGRFAPAPEAPSPSASPPADRGARTSPPAPLAPTQPPAGRAPEPDGANRTIAYDRNARGPHKTLLTLQFYNTSLRRWSDLGQVRGSELELGRSTFRDWNPNASDLAERHVRLVVEDGRLFVQPLPSLNGVYIKLRPNSPRELAPHARFRIGRHVLEFRPTPPAEDPEPRRAPDGEVFQSRTLAPLGFIDLIGPDDAPYLSHPLTKPDEPGTRIGRGGPRCDLALAGDDWASSEHARIVFAAGKCWLEDLKSTNGTFLQINESTPMQLGAEPTPDRGDVVVIGGYMIRVVEDRL